MSRTPLVDIFEICRKPDPHPELARLRKTQPMALASVKIGRASTARVATSYADVVELVKDPQLSRELRLPRWIPRSLFFFVETMGRTDPPKHTRLRSLVQIAFTPRMVESQIPRIEALANELLDRAARKPVFNLVADFAQPLPVMVISEMLGVTDDERATFERLMVSVAEGISQGAGRLLRELPNLYRMRKFVEAMIERRRRAPDDGLLSALLAAEQDGQKLNLEELVAMVSLLFFAGYETTVNLIAKGMLALLDHPEQLKLLAEDPSVGSPC